jgi:hypothetical protein
VIYPNAGYKRCYFEEFNIGVGPQQDTWYEEFATNWSQTLLFSAKAKKFYFRKKRDGSIGKKYRSYFRILTLCSWMVQNLQCNVKHTFITFHIIKSWFQNFLQVPTYIAEAFHEFSSLKAIRLKTSYFEPQPFPRPFNCLIIIVVMLNYMTDSWQRKVQIQNCCFILFFIKEKMNVRGFNYCKWFCGLPCMV